MNTDATPERLLWPDLIRALAIALVVAVHVSGQILNNGYYTVKPIAWWFALAVNGIGRCGVPLFFMISGALLLGKANEPISTFFRKRASRIGIAFIVWSMVYLIIVSVRTHVPLTPAKYFGILATPAYYHPWFFYSIIGLYLLVPVFRFLDANGMKYVSIFWLCSIPVLFMLHKVYSFTIQGNFTNIFPTYAGFLTIGYQLAKGKYNRGVLILSAVVFVLGSIVSVGGTGIVNMRHNGALDTFLYDYRALNIIAMSVALFILLQKWGSVVWPAAARSAVQSISACGLGIFVIHPLLLDALRSGKFGISLSSNAGNPLLSLPLTFVVVMLLSWLITFLILKIPVLRACV